MTDYYPREKKYRYYFAYYFYNGLYWPMKWTTESGITVGGHPTPAINPIEIEAEDFGLTLTELVRKYPRQELTDASLKSNSDSV